MMLKKPAKLLPLAIALGAFAVSGVANAGAGYRDGAKLPTNFAETIIAEDHGVTANDTYAFQSNFDDAPALQAIIDSIPLDNSPNNRIRILLPEGNIHLGQEIHVDRSGIVIEGAGINKTQIIAGSWKPYGVAADGAPLFPLGSDGKEDKSAWPGFGVFRAETRISHSKENPAVEGSVNEHWNHSIEVAQSAKPGDTEIFVEANHVNKGKIKVGDLLYVGSANDEAFLNYVQVPSKYRDNSNIKQGHMRNQIANVVAIDPVNHSVTIDTPLEFNIEPLGYGGYKSRVMPITAVEDIGFRNFTLTLDKATTECADFNAGNFDEDTNPKGVGHKYINFCPRDAIHGIILKYAVDSWIENVNFLMTGSHPIVTEFAQSITFKNNKIDGSWNKGKGGNGYFRGSKLFDSLITGNDIQNVRHLTLQWSASGNIVENNTMNVDMNLHGGWERNNIIRNNTIAIPYEHRSWDTTGAGDFIGFTENETWQPIWFGSSLHASKWAGPTGPNNVFYNNTMSKAQTEGAAITRWGLFDETNTAYAFAWDGNGFVHPTLANGDLIPTWGNEVAQEVFDNMPSSGVVKNNELPEPFDITLTSPRDGAEFALGNTLVVAADVTGNNILHVNFIINGELITADADAPFEFNWQPTATGTYSVYAVAVKNDSSEAPSNSRNVIISNVVENPDEGENIPEDPTETEDPTIPDDVVIPPPEEDKEVDDTTFTVELTAPTNNSNLTVNKSTSVQATVVGNDIKQVKFYANLNGSNKYIGQDGTAPYALNWTPAEIGSYKLYAIAVKNDNTEANSTQITVNVVAESSTGTPDVPGTGEGGDTSVSVELTSPSNNSSFTVNTDITINANVVGNDVKQVKFYASLNGSSNQIGQDGTAAYSINWKPSVVGSYKIYAVAVKNDNSEVTSAQFTVNVVAADVPGTGTPGGNDPDGNTPDGSDPDNNNPDTDPEGDSGQKPNTGDGNTTNNTQTTKLTLFGAFNPLIALLLAAGLIGLRRRS